MGFFNRTERGSLSMRSLDLQILIGEMFQVAKDEEEVEWIHENLQAIIDIMRDEKTEILAEGD